MGKLQKDEETKISQMKKKKKEGKTNGDQISMNKLSMVPEELCCSWMCTKGAKENQRECVLSKHSTD